MSTQRYTPQSPVPFSPPSTPSPTSRSTRIPSKLSQELGTPHIDTPATTPIESSSPAHPHSPSSAALSNLSNAPPPNTIGMNINNTEEEAPQPAGVTSLKADAASGVEMARSFTDPSTSISGSTAMTPNRSSGAIPTSSSNLTPTIPRVRSHSPSPINLANSSNGFASSSSYYASTPGSEQRERVLSPTKPSFDTVGGNDTLPLLQTQTLGPNAMIDHQSPIWSPAIDGKKEPSIKPTPFGYEGYEPTMYAHPTAKNRGRSPYVSAAPGKSEYQGHPLTREAHGGATTAPVDGGFYDSAPFWLGLYFFFNLGLTLFNKIVLVSFPFPYTLTGLHALSGCAGCYIALEKGAFTPARLTTKESLILAAFSVLYTINIAVSNISLQLVTVPFHQVVRASTPLFTIIISTVVLRTRFSAMKLISLLPVVAGVGFATYGDYYFTAWGLILTLLGTFLAALKTVVTNLIQTGGGQRLKLHPLDLLMRMSPLAFIQCVAYGWYTGELERVRRYGATQMTRSKAIALLVNGVIACGLNIVSFTANKKAGALTMTVSANCKQVLTIALAVVLFDLNISPTNGVGILLTLIGGGWYGWVEFSEKRKKTVKVADKS